MSIELQVGYISGIQLELQTLEDHFEKSIVRYEYPFVDGADLEDLGEKASTVKVRCYFFDNAAQSTYNDHIALLNLLRKKSDHEFIHPKYGVMAGKIESVDVRHNDQKRCAEVDFTFIKRGIDNIDMSTVDAVDSVVEGLFVTNLTEISYSLAAPAPKLPVKPLSFLRQIDAGLGRMDAMATAITQPINSLVATISYSTALPGRILGTLDRYVERVARLHDGIAQFPARFLNSIEFGLTKVESDLDSFLLPDRHGAKTMLMQQIRLASARRLALETAYIYSADKDARRAQKSQGKSFDLQGNYTQRVELAVKPLDVNELEESLAAARSRLAAAVAVDRSLTSLKSMALALQNAVDQVKASSERIITVTVDAPLPLQILCLRSGLPYSDAERIMALNPRLRRPNFVSGEVQVYGR